MCIIYAHNRRKLKRYILKINNCDAYKNKIFLSSFLTKENQNFVDYLKKLIG